MDTGALRAALVSIYPELRRYAHRLIYRERSYHTLEATALVNEAACHLLQRNVPCDDPRQLVFYGIREMRTILIDYGRRHRTRKDVQKLMGQLPQSFEFADLAHLHLCLDSLGVVDSRAQQVVELRFFGGLTVQETADFLEISTRTVHCDWEFARCWLAEEWARTSASIP
jgi:RNA polymerase sigma factor (TIGR02999 family)